MDYTKAINLLESFKVKDPVRVFSDDHAADMYVSRTARRSDGKFGSPQSTRITVTYGPGRYAREVTADQLVHGLATIEARSTDQKYYLKDDGVGRVYFTWESLVSEAVETMQEYAASLRTSADWHDDRNHHLAEQVDEAREGLLAIKDPTVAEMPIEITIGTLYLKIGKKGGEDVNQMTDTYPVGSPTEEDKKKETTPPPPPPAS